MHRMNEILRVVTLLALLFPSIISAIPTASSAPPTHSTACPFSTQIQPRFPPTVRNNTPPNWTPPPYAWIFGNWWVTHSSRLSYQQLYNFQADTYPAFPTDNITAPLRRNIDLTSWNLPKTGNATIDTHIYSVFGYDTPATMIAPAVYQFNGTGPLSSISNSWEILAWGYDTNGHGYRAEYETAVIGGADGPCINIVSRAEVGPDETTLSAVVAALRRLFDGSEVAVYVSNITSIHNDGRRSGLGPVACDQKCIDNTNIAP